MIKNKKDVNRLESELNYIQGNINSFTEDHFNQKIKDRWKILKENTGEENLKKMPIDAISTLEKGMPINLLVNNGFRTIYDIKDQTAEDLMQINGIGPISAYPIYDAVSKIK